jgi:hypothetical protein
VSQTFNHSKASICFLAGLLSILNLFLLQWAGDWLPISDLITLVFFYGVFLILAPLGLYFGKVYTDDCIMHDVKPHSINKVGQFLATMGIVVGVGGGIVAPVLTFSILPFI